MEKAVLNDEQLDNVTGGSRITYTVKSGDTLEGIAKQMGVSYTVFNEILNGKRPVTTEYALLLEAALGTNASIWIGLQADYNMQKAKQDKPFMKRLEKIRKIAAVF